MHISLSLAQFGLNFTHSVPVPKGLQWPWANFFLEDQGKIFCV